MHPSALLLIVLVSASAGAAACAAASTTPAARFWEETLPGTPAANHRGTRPERHRSQRRVCSSPTAASARRLLRLHIRNRMRRASNIVIKCGDGPTCWPRSPSRRGVHSVRHGKRVPGAAARRRAEGLRDVPGGHPAGCRAYVGYEKDVGGRVGADTPSSGLPRQEYEVVAAVALLDGRRHVTCHNDPFPYAVYRCHMDKDDYMSTEAYVLTLRGLQQQHGSDGSSESSPLVDMVAVCHLDTSKWSPAHPAFKTLNLQPGAAPLCHFMPYADLLFSDNADNP
ncbi:unnamed protein product [Urochloa decumbens]|uniref:BURP domain-containing protein n=1 Tax=Urochloa decumbens TaxID=240449 RepID=A0ABC8VWI4_9POAL